MTFLKRTISVTVVTMHFVQEMHEMPLGSQLTKMLPYAGAYCDKCRLYIGL